MAWEQYLLIWVDQINRIKELFPHIEPAALDRFRGNIDHFAAYLADTHDLTFREGMAAIEDRLLIGVQNPLLSLQAAE